MEYTNSVFSGQNTLEEINQVIGVLGSWKTCF